MSSDKQRIALVTGSATGIGRSCAIQLAQRGLDVVVNYSKSEQQAKETASLVEQVGRRALLCRCDVSVEDQILGMIEHICAAWGGVDVLINNAATTAFVDHRELDQLTDEIWDSILQTNVKGAFYCVRGVIPIMQARGGGSIVNVASVAGIRGAGSSIPYAASKGALLTMTKSLAVAFAPEIRVNAVAPGPVETRWLEDHQDRVDAARELTPMRRISSPDEVAEVIAFLALDGAMITGQCLVVDGGRTV